jgi:hypothetical protein
MYAAMYPSQQTPHCARPHITPRNDARWRYSNKRFGLNDIMTVNYMHSHTDDFRAAFLNEFILKSFPVLLSNLEGLSPLSFENDACLDEMLLLVAALSSSGCCLRVAPL